MCGKELGQLSGLKMMTEDSKMASVLPRKEKKLLEVELGELPRWTLMRDFTPSGIAGAFQRGYYRYYNKYVNEKRGSIAGLSLVLAAYAVSATAVLTRSANKSGYASATEEGALCIPDHHLCQAPLNPFKS